VLIVILALALLAVLALTVLGDRREVRRPPVSDAPPDPSRQDVARAALEEIELDRAMGKLAGADYRTLRARYEQELLPAAPARSVAGLTAQKGVLHGATEPVRALMPADFGEHLEQVAESLVRQRRAAVRIICAACGPRPEPDARFCSTCGRFLEPCSRCGSPVLALGARFCPRCGATLS